MASEPGDSAPMSMSCMSTSLSSPLSPPHLLLAEGGAPKGNPTAGVRTCVFFSSWASESTPRRRCSRPLVSSLPPSLSVVEFEGCSADSVGLNSLLLGDEESLTATFSMGFSSIDFVGFSGRDMLLRRLPHSPSPSSSSSMSAFTSVCRVCTSRGSKSSSSTISAHGAMGAESGFSSMDRGGDEEGGDFVDGKGAEWAFCSSSGCSSSLSSGIVSSTRTSRAWGRPRSFKCTWKLKGLDTSPPSGKSDFVMYTSRLYNSCVRLHLMKPYVSPMLFRRP
mmetsp:Transcript_6637/g.11496  ORF Transcript_6637/g.11496 Transcript_6637/m.11496 type:complete len:278 (-) Transcript_6637:25-858(-)